MIKTLFDWLDRCPNSYWVIALMPTLWLVVHVVRLIRHDGRQQTGPGQSAGRIDALLLLLFLLAWRWPFLFSAEEFNPDESQLIAGAITLTHDPVFWRSVDGTTSGPLNFYALLPLHALGLPLDYFTARLTGLLLIWGSLFLLLRALTRQYDRATAWLGVIPTLAFFATVLHPDLLHFSSEHVPLLLLALPIGLLAGREPVPTRRLFAACFFAGLAPWAKLQTTPLALVLFLWAGWQLYAGARPDWPSWAKRAGGAVLAALTPTLVVLLLLLATGQLDTALRRYVVHNLIYVSQNTDRPVGEAVLRMLDAARFDGRVPYLVVSILALAAAATFWGTVRRVRPTALFLWGMALSFMAFLAVITPHREFLHYALLLPVPLTLWCGSAVGTWRDTLPGPRSRLAFALIWLLLGGMMPLLSRTRQPVPATYGQFAYDWRHPRNPVSMLVHALTQPGESLGVWGWAPSLYVETKRPQATRDAHTVWSILPNQQQDYHRSVYLADLQRSRPAVFVDAVGPGAFAFEHRAQQRHEIFPALAAYVSQNYLLVRDLPEARIYARKDNPLAARLTTYQVDLLLAKGRSKGSPAAPPPAITPLDQVVRKDIAQLSVMMMLPPTTLEWPLDADVRTVTLEYGFDPEAYVRGTSNGAEVIVELTNLTRTRPVFQRLLDPTHVAADRGTQRTTVTLPPFETGTHLIVRTTAGPFGDNSWDWVYLASLHYQRSRAFLREQFPGFNRVPDVANAETSGYYDGAKGRELFLHAPATLAYLLTGRENSLQFRYGFKPGAYSEGGHTDGATFRVTLQRDGQPNRSVFERLLNPGRNPADQGPQQTQLTLPRVQQGDSLIIDIDPGPAGNAAWDWTYIDQLNLQ